MSIQTSKYSSILWKTYLGWELDEVPNKNRSRNAKKERSSSVSSYLQFGVLCGRIKLHKATRSFLLFFTRLGNWLIVFNPYSMLDPIYRHFSGFSVSLKQERKGQFEHLKLHETAATLKCLKCI